MQGLGGMSCHPRTYVRENFVVVRILYPQTSNPDPCILDPRSQSPIPKPSDTCGVERMWHNKESRGQILAKTWTISWVQALGPLAGMCQEKPYRRPHPALPIPRPRPLHHGPRTSIPNPETFGYWRLALVKHGGWMLEIESFREMLARAAGTGHSN